jgi:hypothetical protein
VRRPWRPRGGAAEHRLHAGDDLARGEGLGDVVVGAELDADDPVDLVVAARQEQHGHVALRTQAAADLQPVHARHVDVEHDQIGRVLGDAGQRGLPVRGLRAGEAGLFQREHEQLADVRVVVHDEHGARLRTGDGHRPRGFDRRVEHGRDMARSRAWGAVGGVEFPCRRGRRKVTKVR